MSSSSLPAARPDGSAASRPESATQVRVLYIAGWGRSGSTLLDRVLGQIADFISVGEIREMWRSGCVENRDCGCGRPFYDCPFWTAVGLEAFGGWSNVDLDEITRLRYSLDRGWMTPVLALPRKPSSISESIERYVAYLTPLYRAIHRVSGAETIIDSSNLASHALLLRMIPGIDLRIAHLVRDSRGVAFSWTKAIARHVTDEGTRYLPRYNAMASSLRWTMYNGMASSLHRMDLPQQTIRYEDLMRSPVEEIGKLARFAGTTPQELSFITDHSVNLDVGHMVDGNSMRFRLGEVPLRKDEEWRTKMRPLNRWTVTAITLPLLARYGYVGSHEKVEV